MRLLSYSSGYKPCGVADYNRHLMHALDGQIDVETATYPTDRVPRHRVRSLLALRRTYRRLAARSTEHDAVLVHFASKYWNGGRPVENMLPLFVRHVRSPMVMVLHEWPVMPGLAHHAGRLRAAKAALTRALVARDLGRADYATWIERDMFHRMAHIIVHTPEFRDRLRAVGVPDERITLTPFPLHALPAPAWSRDEVEERFGLHGKRALLLLGLPVARKGFDIAIESLTKLPSDIVLVLVCSEREQRERDAVEGLREVARRHGTADRLVTTGYLDDRQLASMFPVVQAAVAPFTSVSGSSSIAHFFAAGVPVITSELPPMQQALADGAGVALAAPGDAAALARTIDSVLADPGMLARMRDANRRYSASHTFEHLAATVRRLAEVARGTR